MGFMNLARISKNLFIKQPENKKTLTYHGLRIPIERAF